MLGRNLLLLFSVGIISACGSNDSSRLTAQQDHDDRPLLFVGMGGNVSCAEDDQGRSTSPYTMGIYRAFKAQMADDQMSQHQWRTIFSCYTEEDTVYFSTDEGAQNIEETSWEDFAQRVDTAMQDSRAVFLAGHSYGGWLSMKVLQHHATAHEPSAYHPAAQLLTIDPISRVDCNYLQPFGCQSSPQDFSKDERRQLNDASSFWANFYQNQTWFLHASSIKEADENLKIDTTHGKIDNNDDVWARIKQGILDTASR